MGLNFTAIFIASLSSILVGFVWYHPKVFGAIWLKEIGMTQEAMKKGNMIKIFSLTAIYSLMLAFAMPMLVIHQMGPLGMIGGVEFIATAKPSYSVFMKDYGDAFRTFNHGALHGFMSGLFIALPIISINGLFELRSWRYMAIQSGYWIVIMTIMGAIICGWK